MIHMKSAIERAIGNVVSYGDTDIFPFPLDNIALRDNREGAIDLCLEIHKNFDAYLAEHPPHFYDSFVPNGHTGFRWATQIDTFWNIYFLALAIEIGENIENARLPKAVEKIHSYRYLPGESLELFDTKFGWRSFYERARKLATTSKYVVACDISEFYRRIYHHRLENSLNHVSSTDIPSRIMKFLTVFSKGTSYGLPVGGPAARILAESTLNQIDHILHSAGVEFCRFADDFLLFCDSQTDAFKLLLFISEKLQINQGLALQRSKTRVLTSSEFNASEPWTFDNVEDTDVIIENAKRHLFSISLYYDPYSPTAQNDYTELKSQLDQLDVLALLNHEIKKSRIHTPTINRLVKTLRHLPQEIASEAVLTISSKLESFYPCLGTVLIALTELLDAVSDKAAQRTVETVAQHIKQDSFLFRTDVNRAYSARLLARSADPTADQNLLFMWNNSGPVVKREALAALARRKQWMILSDLRHKFQDMSPTERRTMIVCSYALRDEGKHWRQNISKNFGPFESFIHKWIKDRPEKDIEKIL